MSLTSYFLENLFIDEDYLSLLTAFKALGTDIRPFGESHLFELMTRQWGGAHLRTRARLDWTGPSRVTHAVLPHRHSVVAEPQELPEFTGLRRRTHSALVAVNDGFGTQDMPAVVIPSERSAFYQVARG